ncbi:MAG TPA: hypothetical protein DCR43_06325 [Bacteroidales bacterium]|nr:MAG: hypothetical protein A2X11_06430 [Bacteroidetes bacterium GWE2_42_24]OFY25649.1 MAG: hypothetical protein A2X09_01655 [Bacteroidetes bacterium GWF2_43_11]HAQ65449.1 hypothetical protein [Bacteroidales bacterium]HBZ68093.1 hypothetical protein [Bacteroidales bacterium]
MKQLNNLPDPISSAHIVNAIGELAFVIDRKGNFRQIYAPDLKLLTRLSEKLIGNNIRNLFPANTAEQIIGTTEYVLTSGKSARMEFSLPLPEGENWFEARLTPYTADEVFAIAFNYTARRDAEKRLQNSQANLSFILDNTEQSFFLIRKDTRLILMNRSAGLLLERFKLQTRKQGDRMFEILPRGLAYEIAIASRSAIRGANSFFSKEFVFNGEECRFDFEVAPIYGPDHETNIIAVGVNETTNQWNAERKLRESEQRYRFLADNVADVILQMNAAGDLMYVSPGIDLFLGLNPAGVIGQQFNSILAPDSVSEFHSVLYRLNQTKSNAVESLDLQFLSKSGHLVWGEVRFNAVFDNRNRLTDIMGVIRDITLRHETEIKLKETSARLLELNRTKDKFFSLIAHDLKNPMNAICGFAELLNDEFNDLTDEEKRHYVKNVLNSASDINRLLDDLLVWSRTQTGSFSFRPESVNLSLLINEAIIFTGLNAEKKACLVINEVLFEQTVFGDVNMIRTILRNIISNAIKFSYRGGRIIITATQTDQSVCTTISDNGVGMSDQMVSELLNSENSKNTVGTEGEKGTGFGLLISKEFIGHHKGRLVINSRQGYGTAISFTLPLNLEAFKSAFVPR